MAYLARHADRLHPREVLVEVFWPGSEPQQGRASLSTALCSLRRQLEPPGEEYGKVVVADRNAVKLNPDAITTDVADFRAAIEATRDAGESGGQELREEAVDIYKGEFLAGYYEDWVLDEQRRLAEQFHQALAELLSILEDADDLHRAIEYAMRGVKADPLREETHRELIRLHLAAGHRELALRQYRELEQLFARELGISPTPGTRSLVEQIGRQAGRSAAPTAPAPAPLPTSRSLPEAGAFTVLFADRGAGQRKAPLPKSLRRELFRHVRKHGGAEVGDESLFTVDFGGPESALACVVAMHRAFGAGGGETTGKPLRLALDAGPLELDVGGYRGAVLEQGARVLRAGHAGEILCSERAAALASLEPDPGIILHDLGLYRLNKRSAPERLFRAMYAGMAPTDFVPPDARSGHQGRVPTPLTRLVGRGKELSRLHDLLAGDEARLVTVLGPSGIGKTRVALAAAKQLLDVFEGAVWYVSLAELAEPGQVPAAVLRTVRPGGEPGVEPLLQAVEALDVQASVLTLDNFDHLLPDGAEIVRQLLERVPGLRCLVTSRQKLGLLGERLFVLDPLPVPSEGLTPAELLRCPSVELFADRAQAVVPDFQVTRSNASAVTQLCAGLEGIPLSLELAAGRTAALTLTELAGSLGERLDLLVTRDNHRPERHRSVRAALEHSVALLPMELQRLFAKLSVFRGGCMLDGAEEVWGDALAPDHLAQLREAALIVADAQGPHLRFHMLETVRDFAWELLADRDRAAVQRRHAKYYLTLAERAVEMLGTSEQMAWLGRVDAELGNLRAAIAWALEARPQWALRLADSLGHFWELRCYWAEGREALEAALRRNPRAPKALRARGLHQAGWLSFLQGDEEIGRERLEASLELSREIGDHERAAMACYGLAYVAERQDRLEDARKWHEQCMAIGRELDCPQILARSLHGIGYIDALEGNHDSARRYLEETLAIWRRVGSARSIALSLEVLGGLEEAQENWAAAERLREESLAVFREVGDKFAVAGVVAALGRLALRRDNLGDALPRLKESLEIVREVGSKRGIAAGLCDLGRAEAAAGEYSEARAHLEEYLEIGNGIPDAQSVGPAHRTLAEVSVHQGRLADAVRHYSWAASQEPAEPNGLVDHPVDLETGLADLREQLGEEQFNAAWEEARREQAERANRGRNYAAGSR